MMFDRIRIVLVETTHPGNIGAAARAMKTMGLSRLFLVSPARFPHEEAIAMAAGADDILTSAVITQTLTEALADCTYILGTSARLRTLPIPIADPRESAEKICQAATTQTVAIVFGRECAGLTNEELLQCHQHIHIPSDPVFSSLNLAASVQLISYEIRMALLQTPLPLKTVETETLPFATTAEREGFYQQLEATLHDIDFIKSTNLRSLMHKLRRLYQRIPLETAEVNMLRGILTAIQRKMATEFNGSI